MMLNYTHDQEERRAGFARDVYELRRGLNPNLTQRQFAERFGVPVGTIKGVEQGRYEPSCALRVLMSAVALDPAFVERAVAHAKAKYWEHEAGRGARI